MWFGKKKNVPQIDIDGTQLKEQLRETYHGTVGSAELPLMSEKQLKDYFQKWMREIPDAFKKAILDNDGKGRSEVWIFESTYSTGLPTKHFQYAADLFAASLKRCLGLSAKVNVHGSTRSITLNAKELKKFFETPDVEAEKQLHQMGIYR